MPYLKLDDDLFDRTVTLRECYEIMRLFVQQYHERGPLSTGDLLSDITPAADGAPIDPAQLYDFTQVAAKVLRDDQVSGLADLD